MSLNRRSRTPCIFPLRNGISCCNSPRSHVILLVLVLLLVMNSSRKRSHLEFNKMACFLHKVLILFPVVPLIQPLLTLIRYHLQVLVRDIVWNHWLGLYCLRARLRGSSGLRSIRGFCVKEHSRHRLTWN